jgi:glucokinase
MRDQMKGPEAYRDGPRLLADIGGTNARFALETAPGVIRHSATLACADYPLLGDAVRAYLATRPQVDVRHAVIAIANPVDGDLVAMTNHHWRFSIQATRIWLGLGTLLVVNDFAALAAALPGLSNSELTAIGGGAAQANATIGLLGAGTGLGVAGLVRCGDRWEVLPSEGGHVAFSPMDAREQAILAFCWQRYPHVSTERLVSGPGLVLIHEALAASTGRAWVPATSAQIIERGLSGADGLCEETLECFCAMLGTAAANLAVTLGARGGIYIGGGIVPRLGGWFARSPFRARFEHKGRFSGFTAQIATRVITAPYPALAGAAALLENQLSGVHA